MANRQHVFRATALVTVVIILSKACGFVRDMITAAYFGTGVESDAYTAAYSLFYLPVLLFNSCITSTLVPLYVKARRKGGRRSADRFGSNALTLFGLSALVIAAIMYVLSPQLVRLIYAGFSPEKAALTAQLARIMLISLVFNIVSIVLSSVLNANERYLEAQLTGFPLSACVIAATAAFSGRYGITALGWGVFASGILQVLIQLPFVRRGFKYRVRLDVSDPRIRRLILLSVPAMLSMAVSELNHMVDHWLASSLGDGPMSALNYGYKLITFITGILIVPLTTVMFTGMSRMAAEGDKKGIITAMRRCILTVILVILPISIICMICARDVITFAYGSGRFDARSISLTAGAFRFYVMGVTCFGIRDVLNRCFHSLQDTRTPFRVACVAVALNIVLNFILRTLMGSDGLALATTLAGASAMVLMMVSLRKKLRRPVLGKGLRDLMRIIPCALVCAAVCLGMSFLLPPAAGRISALLRLAVISVISLGAYALAAFLLRERQIRELASTLRNRLSGKRGAR